MHEADFSVEKAFDTFRLILPQILFAFFFLISLIPAPFPWLESVHFNLILIPVYYWSVYRPSLVPPTLCFAAGFLMDLLTGMPPGLTALSLLIVQALVQGQQRFLTGQPYLVLWAVFTLVSLSTALLEFVGMSLFLGHTLVLSPTLAKGLATALLFPPVTILLVGIHRILPDGSIGKV